uniref:25S rRNA (uridine-N(3))-methyltransferase BMT5-like domain-containing protein n=1 Tax=Pyrodinium bahamense TaxID=73915 RepID=A0A7S0A692_9DINO|mmetsp:Transcript_24206/g.66561  ORF Transcript_24206/g.66561 Transcript_24206/m.66561 type:complete len:543 (+) Transcript_24206:2-1630(+)
MEEEEEEEEAQAERLEEAGEAEQGDLAGPEQEGEEREREEELREEDARPPDQAALGERRREEEPPLREDDLALEEVPEDMRDTVEGNLALKRILSTSLEATSDGPAAKKRRLADSKTSRQLGGAKADVVAKWRLDGDMAVAYVLDGAEMEDIEAIHKSNWQPNKFDEHNSCAEQISDKLVRARESQYPPGGIVDAVAAFKHRWKLSSEDDKALCELSHKDMRYVMSNYDGTRPVGELVEEAAMTMPDEGSTTDAAPDKPGLFTLGRFNRLELIDPIADALVVGDANLTFSLLLAEHREDLGHVGRIVATTFETIETLRERYMEIDNTVKMLEDQSAEVLHNVDCTRLAVDPRFVDMAGKFGAVYYNFPHAGVVKGFFDSHPFVRWRHENLMQLFFRALRGFVKPGGVVKVASNSQATGVRYSDIMAAAMLSEFVHVETMPFLEWRLRNYRRSYGDRRDANRRPEDGEIYKNQRAHSDMVYCFRYAPTGGTPPKLRIRYPPEKQDLLNSHEGWFKTLSPEARRRRVEDIYKLFLSYVQGIHVG